MLKQLFVVAGLSTALLGFVGCAKEEFVKPKFTSTAEAVGHRFLPAKVDILVIADNTGSTNNIFSQLQGQLSSFASGMQDKFWDYHIGKAAMVNPSPINRVLVNPRFNVTTLPDGTPVPNAGVVPSNRAETNPANFPILEASYATGQGDDTYAVMLDTLQDAQADTTTNFLRPDALLAVVVVTNGYDDSVTNNQGAYVPGGSTRLNSVRNSLVSLKGSSSLIRFYPVASFAYRDGSSSYCLSPGGTALPGHSYHNMLGLLSGISVDVCNPGALSNVLANIESNLEVVRQSYVYSNIVLEEEPVPGSIEVYKNGSALAQSSVNGWEYKGFGTVYTVTAIRDESTGVITALNPGLNQRSGYVIQLNGSARMIGSDVPDVIYEKL